MIPKVIHYCWFGGNEKSKLIKKCINSWKKYCPDYEIKEWNENNFDVEINNYVKEAYEAKKWAFVSDYARLWIVYNYGGIYLDTDVELIKRIDNLLEHNAFFGSEDGKLLNTGLGFGAIKGNDFLKNILDDYENIHFIKDDGTYDTTPCPIRNTDSISYLLNSEMPFNEICYLENAAIYPPEYFSPLDFSTRKLNKTEKTYSIHWYDASWYEDDQKVLYNYLSEKKDLEIKYGKNLGKLVLKMKYLTIYRKVRKIIKKM